jgi:hypothetical protein
MIYLSMISDDKSVKKSSVLGDAATPPIGSQTFVPRIL